MKIREHTLDGWQPCYLCKKCYVSLRMAQTLKRDKQYEGWLSEYSNVEVGPQTFYYVEEDTRGNWSNWHCESCAREAGIIW